MKKAGKFNTLGVMIDLSRNAVMTVEQIKNFLKIISKMGYNEVWLYMEDTFEVSGEQNFGALRGRYSHSELCELDSFATSLNIELVPCIQTLAHLNAIFRWPEYDRIKDAVDILTVGDERVYTLIDNIFKTLRCCFKTSKIHIGMDEAHFLGRGRYADLNGFRDRNTILLEHLNKVCDMAKKYCFEPMMWSDMFYRIANGGRYYALDPNFDENVKKNIPDAVSLVYWDYYHTQKNIYSSMIRGHKKLSDKIIFAGGAWRWSGFAPHNDFAIKTMRAGISSCLENDIKDVIITMWGDDGAECSSYAVLPSLCYAACLAQGITKMADVKQRFKEYIGYSFDDFMLLDLADRLVKTNSIINPSKYSLYNDCFMGIMDSAINKGDGEKYKSFARRLNNAAKRTGEFSYLFETQAKLCSALSLKAELGIRTREIYSLKDKEELCALIRDYKKTIKLLEQFYAAFKTQWFLENKPHGFDIQDMRLGGLIMRLRSCLDRLCDLEKGKISEIPELCEPTAQIYNGYVGYNCWAKTFSANVLSHNIYC